jgi:hypothetical protein
MRSSIIDARVRLLQGVTFPARRVPTISQAVGHRATKAGLY